MNTLVNREVQEMLDTLQEWDIPVGILYKANDSYTISINGHGPIYVGSLACFKNCLAAMIDSIGYLKGYQKNTWWVFYMEAGHAWLAVEDSDEETLQFCENDSGLKWVRNVQAYSKQAAIEKAKEIEEEILRATLDKQYLERKG